MQYLYFPFISCCHVLNLYLILNTGVFWAVLHYVFIGTQHLANSISYLTFKTVFWSLKFVTFACTIVPSRLEWIIPQHSLVESKGSLLLYSLNVLALGVGNKHACFLLWDSKDFAKGIVEWADSQVFWRNLKGSSHQKSTWFSPPCFLIVRQRAQWYPQMVSLPISVALRIGT